MDHFDNFAPLLDTPFYDRSTLTKKLCTIGLLASWIISLGGLGAGIFMVIHYIPDDSLYDGAKIFTTSRYLGETLSLASNVVVTACSDIAGYVHTTSLRWALQAEGRLTFNSNLRLFTATKKSVMNSRLVNGIYLLFLIVSYGASGFLFISVSHFDDHNVIDVLINGYAAIILSVAILIQTLISTIIMFRPHRIHTWSPSAFDTVAACLREGTMQHNEGRCMQSVHSATEDPIPKQPLPRQQSAYRAHHEVRVVFRLIWLPVALAFPWSGLIYALIKNLKLGGSVSTVRVVDGQNWGFFPVVDMYPVESAARTVDPSQTPHMSFLFGKGDRAIMRSSGWSFLICAAVQSIITIGLHCAELLVNTSRDEACWRKTTSRKGLRRTNALYSMLMSRTALTLFALKAFIHWLYSLALRVGWWGLVMLPPQIVYLGAGLIGLALFVTACAFWSPKGQQPAAFGHLQTMADLIDWWPQEYEGMFWGEKKDEDGIAHAGTYRAPLPKVNSGKLYL